MKKNKYLVVLGVILAVILVASVAIKLVMDRVEANLKRLAAEQIQDVDMSRVPDGEYAGSFEAFPISVEVKVVVSGQRIVDIELVKHVSGQGAPANVIADRVVGAQSLRVDTISGATYSSKVILKAIESALTSRGQ